MGIKEDYQKAVTLAKEGKYHEARNLLIVHDDERVDKLLNRINAAIAADGADKPKRSASDGNKSFTTKLVLSVVLLFFLFVPGLIATSMFANEAKQYPNAPGAKAMILLNRFVFGLLVLFLALMVIGLAGVFLGW